MAIPEGVQTATVHWQAQTASIDAEDEDRDPDFTPLVGANVTISCAAPRVVIATAPPTTVVMNTISGTTNEDGILVGPDGLPGLKIVATDNPDINPINFTYNVQITGAGPTISFAMLAPGGTNIDLSSVIPIKSSSGVALTPISVGLPTPGPDGELLTARDGFWGSEPMASGLPDPSLLADGATLTTLGGAWIVVEPYVPTDSPYAAVIKADAPLHYWKMDALDVDEIDEMAAIDLVMENSYTRDEAPIAPSLHRSTKFSNGRARMLYAANVGTASQAMEFWYKRDSSHSGSTFEYLYDGTSGSNYNFARFNPGEGLACYSHGHSGIVSNPGSDVPIHVVINRDSTTGHWTIYINGSQIFDETSVSGDMSAAYLFGAGPLSGYPSTGDWFKGWMSDIAIYDHGLTSAQVLAHYEAGIAT